MLPKLWEEVKPATKETETAIAEVVSFARDQIPAQVWREQFGASAPASVTHRHEHLHLTYNDYRTLSQNVRQVVHWENQTPVFVWPTVYGFRFITLLVAGVVLLVWLPELVGFLSGGGQR